MHASRPRFACLPGLHREHKKIEEYYARVSQRSHQQEHKAFLNSRKQWLQQHNEAGPDKKRLQNKKALLEAKKELSLVQSTGGKFKVPKQFVEKDAWKEDVRGPLDNAKLVKEVIFGKTVEGVWVDQLPKGVYDFESYDDQKMEEREKVHDHRDTPFGEEALERTKKAILGEFAEATQARDKVSVEATAQASSAGLGACLALMHKGAGLEGGEAEPADPQPASESEQEGSGLESSEDERGGKVGFFRPKPAAAKAAPPGAAAQKESGKSVSGKPKQPHAQATGQKKRVSEATSGVVRAHPGADDTVLADGRQQRASKNLKDKVGSAAQELADVEANDMPPALDAASQAAFRQSCLKRASVCKALARGCRDHHKRTAKGKGAESLSDALMQLQAIEAAAVAMQALFQVCGQGPASPDAVVTAYEAASEHAAQIHGGCLGPAFRLKYAMAKASQHCLYGHYDKFCESFLVSDPDMAKLVSALDRKPLAEHVAADVEGRLLLAFKALKLQDVQTLVAGEAESDGVQECKGLCAAVVATAKRAGQAFLAASLADSCALALRVLDADDLAETETAAEELLSLKQDAAETGELLGGGAVLVFFSQHTVGQALLDLATGRVASGEKEARAQASVKALDAKLQAATPGDQPAGVLGAALIPRRLAPLQELLVKCEEEVAALKREKKGDAPAMKQARERCQEDVARQRASLAEFFHAELLRDLKANLMEQVLRGKSSMLVFSVPRHEA